MHWLLFIASLIPGAFGIFVFVFSASSSSAIHEIEGLLLILIATVAFCSGAIVEAISRKKS